MMDMFPFYFGEMAQSVRLSGGVDLPFHISNIGKCHRGFGLLMGTSSFRGLIVVGKLEDQG